MITPTIYDVAYTTNTWKRRNDVCFGRKYWPVYMFFGKCWRDFWRKGEFSAQKNMLAMRSKDFLFGLDGLGHRRCWRSRDGLTFSDAMLPLVVFWKWCNQVFVVYECLNFQMMAFSLGMFKKMLYRWWHLALLSQSLFKITYLVLLTDMYNNYFLVFGAS